MSAVPGQDRRFFMGPFRWLAEPSAAELEAERFTVLDWRDLNKRWVDPARRVGMERKSLDSAAKPWFDWLAEVDRLAVLGIELRDLQTVKDVLGFLVEPAARLGIELVLAGEPGPDELDASAFVDEDFGYPYTFERLLWRMRGARPTVRAPASLDKLDFTPDDTQAEAVTAGEGVVQIIAPAGSGKTAVLVERVRELRSRGAPADAITCVTFNKAAANELRERLSAAEVGDVRASTFHSLGLQVLRRAGRLAGKEIAGHLPTQGQWRWLAGNAMKAAGENGRWLDPPDAKRMISDLKLGEMLTASEYAETITEKSDALARTQSALYLAYEEMQRSGSWLDFDDLILQALRLLREDATVRAHWQGRYEYLLVDEYQDIEPAQELLVRTIAAPQDQVFCVGDEDQTLYAFRRASVARIICLDGLYPALERVALEINYRCPPTVVDASRALIAHNQVRFDKKIHAASKKVEQTSVKLHAVKHKSDSAVLAAQALRARSRREIVVLARTTDALRPTALACADMGVKIDGPDKLFEPRGARLALQQHLTLALEPQLADEKLVAAVCRTPARSLKQGTADAIAEQLQAGAPFEAAFAGVPRPKREQGRLLAPGELFAELAECARAEEAIRLLRGSGGFDSWFADSDGMGGLDEFECEALEQAERDAEGLAPAEYLEELRSQASRLKASRDSENGIELSTIHGAKGRQWRHVILAACEEDVLPHKRSLEVGAEEQKRGEGIEAERRLGYVAFTRTLDVLEIHYDRERPSRFLFESGLLERPPEPKREPRRPPPAPGLASPVSRGASSRLRRWLLG
jgi:DNA helicase-2/ATP-dependent DNA helicase PcrA